MVLQRDYIWFLLMSRQNEIGSVGCVSYGAEAKIAHPETGVLLCHRVYQARFGLEDILQ
jgi:hypothetical protein